MLTRTFLHIRGIGETTERKLWAAGLRNWDEFIEAHRGGALRGRKAEHALGDVVASADRYRAADWNFFDRSLPSPHKWRSFGDLGGQALYVDIETTGMGRGEDITVIGTFDGQTVRSFVAGRDLEQAVELMERYPLIVTFNGAQFDMPIIRSRFRHNLFNHVHVDLRFPLARLGYQGGLKRIEQAFGIERSPRTKGLDGFDAVRLWREYERGSGEALEVLIEYNAEDIRNLEPLMRHVFREMSGRMEGT